MLPWLTGDPYFPCTNSITFIAFIQSFTLDLISHVCNNIFIISLEPLEPLPPWIIRRYEKG